MEVSGQLDAPGALPPAKRFPGTHLIGVLDEPQSRSGRGSEQKNFLPPPRIEPRSSDRSAKNYLFTTASRPALGPPSLLTGALPLGAKRPGREADHSSPSMPRLRISRAIPPLPQHAFMAWCSVKSKNRGNCNFTSTLFISLNVDANEV
jgi:hypothetical protein